MYQSAFGPNLPTIQDIANNPSAFANVNFSEMGFQPGSLGTTPSAFNTQDMLGGLKSGIDLLGGLGGLYSLYQGFRNQNKASKYASEDQAMKRSAFNDYNKFRSNVQSAFGSPA